MVVKMNPFLDKETQTHCPYCKSQVGEYHKEGCQNNPFDNPAAAQKLLAWRPTEEDLKKKQRAIGEMVSHLAYIQKSGDRYPDVELM